MATTSSRKYDLCSLTNKQNIKRKEVLYRPLTLGDYSTYNKFDLGTVDCTLSILGTVFDRLVHAFSIFSSKISKISKILASNK